MDRFKMGIVQPAAYKAMNGLNQYVNQTGIDPVHREMIRIRASQINGCAYCVNEHTGDAVKIGETPQRIFLISVWKEAGDVFTGEEKLLLELTEAVTLIHHDGVPDELYERAINLFGEERTAEIMMAIIVINAWNRIGVGLHMHPHL